MGGKWRMLASWQHDFSRRSNISWVNFWCPSLQWENGLSQENTDDSFMFPKICHKIKITEEFSVQNAPLLLFSGRIHSFSRKSRVFFFFFFFFCFPWKLEETDSSHFAKSPMGCGTWSLNPLPQFFGWWVRLPFATWWLVFYPDLTRPSWGEIWRISQPIVTHGRSVYRTKASW